MEIIISLQNIFLFNCVKIFHLKINKGITQKNVKALHHFDLILMRIPFTD